MPKYVSIYRQKSDENCFEFKKKKPKKPRNNQKNQLKIERKLKQMSVAILFKCKLQKPPTVLVAQ